MKKLAVWMSPYRKECILGPLFKLLEALFELIVPLIIAQLVDQAIPSGGGFFPGRKEVPGGPGLREIVWSGDPEKYEQEE